MSRAALETQLSDFNPAVRAEALEQLVALADAGDIELPEPGKFFNLHAHSFFSFNADGLSPTALAWRARCHGLAAIGLVDFDVLDGVVEHLDACAKLGIQACAGLETRVFIPELADKVINSPGEPGISYHMGACFVTGGDNAPPLLDRLRSQAAQRNRVLVERVNAYLDPVVLDYESDVESLTPAGNATERHICVAYENASRREFPDPHALCTYWSEKLGIPEAQCVDVLNDSAALQKAIRAKTMKAGGVGYVQPEGLDFPMLDEVNAFVKAMNAIPVMTWLDGLSDGAADPDELLNLHINAGAEAVNVIPDRNWNIADQKAKAIKVAALHKFLEAATARQMPIIVGTELNAPGLPFVDDFTTPELEPYFYGFESSMKFFADFTAKQRGRHAAT